MCEKILHGHTHRVWVLECAGDGSRLVSGSCDASVRVWDVVSGSCLHVLRGHKASISCLNILGDVLVTGSEDKSVRMWGMNSGQCMGSFTSHDDWLGCVAQKGKMVVSGSWDKAVKVWNCEEMDCLQKLEVGALPKKVWFEGEKLVLVTSRGELWIWDFSLNQ